MSDMDHDGLDDELHDGIGGEPRLPPMWQPRPWWAWHLAAAIGSAAALLGGGAQLASADLGTSLRARGCDPSALPGITLLLLGGVLAMAALQLARLQHPAAMLGWEWRGTWLTLPVPSLVLAAALPGLLGCALGQEIATLAFVGDALVGASGVAVAGAAAALVGGAIAGAMHVTWQASAGGGVEEPPGIVELAMAEAEALETDAASQRFHGVD